MKLKLRYSFLTKKDLKEEIENQINSISYQIEELEVIVK